MKEIKESTIPTINNETIALTKALVAKPSITPDDHGCQLLIAERLKKLGFTVEHLRFGQVDNLWAQLGNSAPLFVFAGHTDVVPPGPLEAWTSPPFEPHSRKGHLFGRGTADMKGSIAAMVTAVERFLQNNGQPYNGKENNEKNNKGKHNNGIDNLLGGFGSIGFLLTSDEEGPALEGTVKVLEWLKEKNIKIDYCLVGEPTSEEQLGDILKVGRRGSMSGHLKIYGQQKHIAYASQDDNPIHKALEPLFQLSQLSSLLWESEPELPPFPKTSFHIANLHAGTHAWNIVPGHLECQFNFRFSPAVSPEFLQEKVRSLFENFPHRYELNFQVSGLPFLTEQGHLRNICSEAITEELNIIPNPSASGGTSDARFIAQTGCEVVEFGPIRHSIHAIDECVRESDLVKLSLVYESILKRIVKSK